MSQFPVLISSEALLRSITEQERILTRRLGELEGEIRNFEDTDAPSYRTWIRCELGPQTIQLEEILASIHEKRTLALRIARLVQNYELHPREALYLVKHADELSQASEEGQDQQKNSKQSSKNSHSNWNQEEVQARRQAKLESKREARRHKKKQERMAMKSEEDLTLPPQKRLTTIYRALARVLHPDSPDFIQTISSAHALDLWLEVQTAYNSGQSERLLALAAWLETEQGGGKNGLNLASVLTVSERMERVRAMKRSCSKLSNTLSQLKVRPEWKFTKQTSHTRRKILQKATRALSDETSEAQSILDDLEDWIKSIGSPRMPRKNSNYR